MTLGVEKEFSTNLFYMDTYINVKIYTTNNKAKTAFEEVESIYKEYHNLTNRYDKESALYKLNNEEVDSIYLDVDKKLYDLISYGKDMYLETNGLVNINMGNVIDIWKNYRDKGVGIPSISELKNSGSISIDNVILEDGKLLNKNFNIDLGAITKGYVTEIVGDYLESIGINKYIINAGGNVKVGKSYNKDTFNIGIESPLKDGSIYQVIKGENISVVTSGSYERFYEYEGKLYHHIIDPNTLMPPNYMKSVTVITNDSKLADTLSTTLFLMSVDDGLKFIEKYDNVEAIWFIDSDNIIKSKGFDKYE